ncbi:MAG TPA: SDR family oxidoreductase [Polyangiales bacterium]|nr:SDR family oxidoreductase [Polyangiales bacterium]
MRIAVIGGTGLAGSHTVHSLKRANHAVVVISRSHGVDVFTGRGLEDALRGVETVIDASSINGDEKTTSEFFTTSTGHILEAERRAGVKHHVLLSIVGIDRIGGNAHFAGKRAQEKALESSPIPITIQRATQFFEFAEMIVGWTRQGDTATLPPLLLQPMAAADIGDVLAEIAAGPAQGRAIDVGGPEPQDLVDLARRILTAKGETIRLIPSWSTPIAGVEAAGEAFLPGPEARLAPTTFDVWLATRSLANQAKPT